MARWNPIRSLARRLLAPVLAIRDLVRDLARLRAMLEDVQKSNLALKRKVNALLRAQYLSGLEAPELPYRITRSRFQLRSQNEEDGLIVALFRWVGAKSRTFVEIGCGGTGGNSGLLAYECGWSGLMIDIAPENVDKVQRLFRFNPGVTACCARVTPENIDDLLRENRCPAEVDLLSLDIDSYDYWVLEALSVCRPRLLVVEYNHLFGPTRAVTVPRDADLSAGPKGYHGASLAAFERLARRKGYRLLFCDDAGVNGFYLRDDVAPEAAGVPAERAFRGPKTGTEDFIERLRATGVALAEV